MYYGELELIHNKLGPNQPSLINRFGRREFSAKLVQTAPQVTTTYLWYDKSNQNNDFKDFLGLYKLPYSGLKVLLYCIVFIQTYKNKFKYSMYLYIGFPVSITNTCILILPVFNMNVTIIQTHIQIEAPMIFKL